MQDLNTWQDVLDSFYGIVGDTQANGVWFTAATVESWANQTLVEMGEHSGCIELDVTTVTVNGTSEYTFNTTGHATYGVNRVEVDDEVLLPTNRARLFAENRSWHTQTGTPFWYYRDGLNDFDEVGLPVALWPKPDVDGLTLRAILTVAPSAVSNSVGSATVQLPLWAVPGLLWGTLAMAYTAETRLRNLQTAQVFRTMYTDVVDRLKGRTSAKTPRSVAYGGSPTRGYTTDWRKRFPTSGFEV